MTDEFFESTAELQTIYRWARARFAAPWAVFGAVLLRVAASTGPHVQLPGVIGGRASLNMIAAFVSASGGGKGISDKVARMAWPSPILERPIGSGEGIAALFAPPKKEGADRVTRAIINVTEIDTLSGIAARQGSILLAQLKAAVMGELIGQSNASEATSRVVQPHTYRMCMSVGAQPGHTSVIFNDSTGGTPQRILWFSTTDPDMPAEASPDPEPLNWDLPVWALQPSGIQTPSNEVVDVPTEIAYGPSEIAETIVQAHLARQRGEADALDGHQMLTRCKVAATLAILHHRIEVSELDWQLSGEVMSVSDATRDWIVEQARQSARAKVRARALDRAAFDEIIDDRHTKTVRNRIVRLLQNGPLSRSDLRRAMGKQHYREAFDALLPHLEKISQLIVIQGEKAPHYALNPEFTGEPEFTPRNTSSGAVNHEFTGEPPANVTDLDSRRSHDSDPPKLSCQKWFNAHIDQLREAGTTTVESFAVYSVGEAEGYRIAALRTAASNNPNVTTIDRTSRGSTWDITGASTPSYRSAREWISKYLDSLPAGTTAIDKDDFHRAARAQGYSDTATRHAALKHDRIESVQTPGRETTWMLKDDADGAAS